MTKILDPITRESLDVFGYDTNTSEVYRCNIDKIIASIQSEFRCDKEEAIRKLQNSDIDNPVKIGDEHFWSE